MNKKNELPAARVIVAREPDEETIEKIRHFVKARGGSDIQLVIDQNIIGGIVIYIGDIVYDGSIRSRLEKIKRSI